MHRHVLSDREWDLLAPLLPQRARTGRPPADHRTIIDALLWLAKTGAPWRDLPDRLGPWARLRPASTAGPGRACGSASLPRCAAWRTPRTASTGMCTWSMARMCVRTTSLPGLRGQHRQALGRSRCGFGSKLHLRCDRRGWPMAFVLSAGERNERTALPELMSQSAVKRSGHGPAQAAAADRRWRSRLYR